MRILFGTCQDGPLRMLEYHMHRTKIKFKTKSAICTIINCDWTAALQVLQASTSAEVASLPHKWKCSQLCRCGT